MLRGRLTGVQQACYSSGAALHPCKSTGQVREPCDSPQSIQLLSVLSYFSSALLFWILSASGFVFSMVNLSSPWEKSSLRRIIRPTKANLSTDRVFLRPDSTNRELSAYSLSGRFLVPRLLHRRHTSRPTSIAHRQRHRPSWISPRGNMPSGINTQT